MSSSNPANSTTMESLIEGMPEHFPPFVCKRDGDSLTKP